jgi:ribosomal 50S subunit-recycling heat shock protein
VVIFALSERVFSLRIEALGDRRGPAPEARRLYSEAPSQAQA